MLCSLCLLQLALHGVCNDLLLSHGILVCRLTIGTIELAGRLCTAVFEGNVTLLKRLLHAGAPPETADYDGRTCLHIAAAGVHRGAKLASDLTDLSA